MKNILITGGAGFIGSNFIHYFLNAHKDYKVINLDSLTYAGNLENLKEIENNPNYTFIKGSITDLKLCEKIFEEHKIDGVVNFAAESHVDRSILGSHVFIDTNIVGTHTLLECAKKNNVERFLQVSTDEVYGSLGAEGAFTESTPLAPNSPYSASKASADLVARSYFKTHKLPVITTRCSNNYGPFQFPEKLIPLIISNCINGKPLPIYGKGENVRDWIHALDHSKAIDTVFHKGKAGDVYNVGSKNEWKNIDIVKLICAQLEEKLGKEKGSLESLITYVKDRPGHDMRYAIDNTKIETELGWVPEIKFQDGISATIDWYLDNKTWVEDVTSGNYQKYYEKHYGDRDKTF